MSAPSHFAATLLLVSLTGAASASQLKGPDLLFNAAGRDDAVLGLAAPPTTTPDAMVWPMAKAWTASFASTQWATSILAESATDKQSNAVVVPTSKMSLPQALVGKLEALPRPMPGSPSPDQLDDAFLSKGDVFDYPPDIKVLLLL